MLVLIEFKKQSIVLCTSLSFYDAAARDQSDRYVATDTCTETTLPPK